MAKWTFQGKYAAIALLVVFSACAPVYLPPSAVVPMVEQKGDWQVGGYGGTCGFDLQVLGAASKHVLAGGNLSFSSSEQHTHTYGEGFAGFYLVGEGAFRASVLGGLGIGKSMGEGKWTVNNNTYVSRAEGSYLRPFVQGSMGVHTRAFDVGFMARMAHVTYNYDVADPNVSNTRASHLFVEPVVYIGAGYRPVKGMVQMGLAWPPNQDLQIQFNPFIVNFGIQVQIDRNREK